MVIEDYAPPETIAADFERTASAQYAYRGPMAQPCRHCAR